MTTPQPPDAIWCLYPQEHDTARELKGQVKYLRATPVREHASELLSAVENIMPHLGYTEDETEFDRAITRLRAAMNKAKAEGGAQ